MEAAKTPIPFYPIVQRLENALGSTAGTMKLFRLVSKSEFLKMRQDVAAAFFVGEVATFAGEYDDEDVEFGDLTDAVRGVTFSLYPQSTPMEMLISFADRQKWCSKVLEAMDIVVR